MQDKRRTCPCPDKPAKHVALAPFVRVAMPAIWILILPQAILAVGLADILAERGLGAHPAGLVGCRSTGMHAESCAYDMVVFDAPVDRPDMVRSGDDTVILYGDTLLEKRPAVLAGYLSMNLVQDASMVLASFLSSLQPRRDALFSDLARGSLAESMLCAGRAMAALDEPGDLGSCWQRCASLYLGDAILAIHGHVSSSHALQNLRRIRGTRDEISISIDTLGLERASRTLLDRMIKWAVGLSDLVGGMPAAIIRFKAETMLADHRISDCYHYLCDVSRTSLSIAHSKRIRGPSLEYAARVAFDVERDLELVRSRAETVHEAAGRLLEEMAHA